MKSIKFILILFILIWSKHQCWSQEFKLDIKNSKISWTGTAAFSSYSLTGTLKAKSGILKMDQKTITNLKVVIDMKSLNHENKDLRRHLKSEDFFEVNKYPTSEFRLEQSTSVDKGTLSGYLVIKNQKHQEDIPITLHIEKNQISFIFEFDVDRTKYGINHNSPSIFKKLKETAIADNFKLKGRLVFIK